MCSKLWMFFLEKLVQEAIVGADREQLWTIAELSTLPGSWFFVHSIYLFGLFVLYRYGTSFLFLHLPSPDHVQSQPNATIYSLFKERREEQTPGTSLAGVVFSVKTSEIDRQTRRESVCVRFLPLTVPYRTAGTGCRRCCGLLLLPPPSSP